ncbi:universal stress protein [Planosporangium thailandense]|uniref:Universal stress protein n=1 Tax=Planosporangium thailandense TaxID=765197 RepID=A0ABX0Y7Q4_9ACTN|nr:universal stress protein [Planosporangium thailandense]NJC73309.1 universal stress protein [Planosporangium thailandense]
MDHHIRGTGWIIVGLSGYDNDAAVLTVALRQAVQSGSSLCVVRTLGLRDDPPGIAPGMDGPTRVMRVRSGRATAVGQQVRHEVEQVAADLAPGTTIEYEVEIGDPATALLAAAWEADLIVMGTRCDGATPALMLGQVSQDVAVHSRCPILLVPSPP